MELSAVFFDVDGTIAETEEYHRKSFNESFKEFSLDWFWDEAIYKELINIIHDNATFHSPVVFTPQEGKKKVIKYLLIPGFLTSNEEIKPPVILSTKEI